MEPGAETEGKAYVHYRSWHETYPGLVDASYLEGVTGERGKRARSLDKPGRRAV